MATDGDRVLSDAETLRLLVEEARLAESVGLDVFSVGEHYRAGHIDSATPVLLAAIATRDRADPARHRRSPCSAPTTRCGVYQRVLDARRASPAAAPQIDPRPRLGHRVVPAVRLRPGATTSELFEEKLDLFVAAAARGAGHLVGHRPRPADRAAAAPALRPGGIPTWIGVGGSPNSVVRAARYGLPLMLAIIGGEPAALRRPTSSCTTARSPQLGHAARRSGVHSPGLVADTDEEAAESSGRTTGTDA